MRENQTPSHTRPLRRQPPPLRNIRELASDASRVVSMPPYPITPTMHLGKLQDSSLAPLAPYGRSISLQCRHRWKTDSLANTGSDGARCWCRRGTTSAALKSPAIKMGCAYMSRRQSCEPTLSGSWPWLRQSPDFVWPVASFQSRVLVAESGFFAAAILRGLTACGCAIVRVFCRGKECAHTPCANNPSFVHVAKDFRRAIIVTL